MNYYQRHIGDWMVATAHLTEVEECIYSRMLDVYYTREKPLPADIEQVCRLVRATTTAAKKAVAVVLREFFVEGRDGWRQKRCDAEIQKYQDKHAKAVDSARSGWCKRSANAEQMQCKRNANQEPVTNNQEPVNTKDLVMSDSPAANADVVPLKPSNGNSERRTQAREILAFLNGKTGRHYRETEANLVPIMARLKEGASIRELRAVVARKCREWGNDERMGPYLRPATLFNATKFAQYVGEVPPEEADAAVS